MQISQLNQALNALFANNITPLIVGHRGIGKSETMRQYAKLGGHRLADFRVGQMADTADLIGLFDLAKNGEFAEFRMPKRIYDVIQFAKENPTKYSIMMFDEANRGTKDILQAIFEVILDNSLNGNVFPRNVKAVLLINPPTPEYDVLNFDDSAFLDRCCAIKFDPDKHEWVNYARSASFDNSIIDFIGEMSDMLDPKLTDFTFSDDSGINIKPSRRSWERVSKLKKWFDDQSIGTDDDSVFTQLVMGLVGSTAGLAYTKFLKTYDKILQAEDILKDFKKHKDAIVKYSAEATQRTDVLNELNGRIVAFIEGRDKLTKVMSENLVNYIMTIPKDIAVGLTLKIASLPAVTVDKHISHDEAFVKYIEEISVEVEDLEKDGKNV